MRTPIVAELHDVATRDIVVMIPGMTGTQLREHDSGRIAWGDTRSLLSPKDGGRTLALSLDDPRASASRLEPVAPIGSLSFLGVRREIYNPVQRLFESHGYRTGDLATPAAAEDFFFYNYDWRLGAIDAARTLTHLLEGLRDERDDRPVRVALICQSSAGLIGRWVVKYGATSLEQAEAGGVERASGVEVTKLIFVGASNGGALRVLRQLNEGRRYIRAVGRRMRPETLFTFPSLYEGLPLRPIRPFIDDAGNLLDVDLFDPEAWERYGWSIYAPEVRKRIARKEWTELLGSESDRQAFLATMLDRAQRLHTLLQADPPGFDPPRYYSLQNDSESTALRALLTQRKDRWATLFHDSRKIRSDPGLLALAAAPGDGHATMESQGWFSPTERAALAHEPARTPGSHFEIILDPELQRLLLEYLLE